MLFVDVKLYRITVQRDITGTVGFVAIVTIIYESTYVLMPRWDLTARTTARMT